MMNVFLLFPGRSFPASEVLPPLAEELERDLELEVIFDVMSGGDEFLRSVVRQVILSPTADAETIRYRQDILRDSLNHPEVVEELYHIPIEFYTRKHEHWLWVPSRHSNPTHILAGARHLLEESLDLLRRLREIADKNIDILASQGLKQFLSRIQQELTDQYLDTVAQELKTLRFQKGVLVSARLGEGNEGTDYTLSKPLGKGFLNRMFSRSPSYSYTLPPRDEAGARSLAQLRDRGLARVANAVAQAAEHVESFFDVLRWELAFYKGALNLKRALDELGEPTSFPEPLPLEASRFFSRGLYDPTLALTRHEKVVGNDISSQDADLFIITGPNRGGKTVFLRSVGVAQLMMQSGLFVPAETFRANLVLGIFTHFPREEDRAMESGRLVEELKRMSSIVDQLRPRSLVLFNESFASTNEREGAEIAGQIVNALLDREIEVFYVTHNYELARRFREGKGRGRVVFLRAERLPDGTRTFKIKPGAPSDTSHGMDLYRHIFGSNPVLNRDR